MNIIKETVERSKTPTPKFWRKIRNAGAWLTAFCIGVPVVIATGGLAIPALLSTALAYGAVAGGVLTLASQLAKVSVSDVDEMDFDEAMKIEENLIKKQEKEGLTEHEQKLKDAVNHHLALMVEDRHTSV